MKKLLVVLAVLFASVAAYATAPTPVSETGKVYVDVLCPLGIALDGEGSLSYIIYPGQTHNFIPAGEGTVSPEVINWLITDACEEQDYGTKTDLIVTTNVTPTEEDYEVTLGYNWLIDGSVVSEGATDNVEFDGELPVQFRLNTITAGGDADPDVEYEWTLTVTAMYTNI